MDFLASPLGVAVILGIVAVAAFAFEPGRYVGDWCEMAKRYETSRRPSSIAFPAEEVSLGLYEFAHIDAALDDEGFWILYNGPEPKKIPACVLVPWDCIRFKEEQQNRHNFQIRLQQPLEFHVSHELGAALRRRSQSMPGGSEG